MEAQELVLALKAHHLTQAQIGKETGIAQPTISKIERGEVDDVMSKNYRALKALHAKVVRAHARRSKGAPKPAATQES